jgi:hypothetical protein
MLEMLWRKRNPQTLFVEMETSVATTEILRLLKILKINLLYDPCHTTLGHIR